MKAHELFKLIRDTKGYIKSGDDVDWLATVNHKTKNIFLLFSASNSKTDWRNSFRFASKVYKNQTSCIRAHRGWAKAYKSCNDETMGIMVDQSRMFPEYSLNILGWSYGGAIAVLAAEDYFYRTGQRANLITFGAPKPLWGKKSQEYVRSCIANCRQYTNVNDIVTYLPPFLGYKRISTDKMGKPFSLKKLLKPRIYHCAYDEPDLYKAGDKLTAELIEGN